MRTAAGIFVLGAVLAAGCGGSVSDVEPVAAPVAAVSADPVVRGVTSAEWKRMVALGMAGRNCPVERKNLRRIEINHYGFDGRIQRGALVVRGDVAGSVKRIFTRLFDERFPIQRMIPIEHYRGSDNRSMAANNTSAYNCRRPSEANSPSRKSPHANGRAIDINPFRNPWINPSTGAWEPSAKYAKRTPGKGKILKGGLVWRLFTNEGWIWQNISTKDYQHFDTGYPSKPFKRGR